VRKAITDGIGKLGFDRAQKTSGVFDHYGFIRQDEVNCARNADDGKGFPGAAILTAEHVQTTPPPNNVCPPWMVELHHLSHKYNANFDHLSLNSG
jgi:hypothetical protein